MKSEFEFAEVVDKDEITSVRPIPIEDVLRQHNKRFVIRTEGQGDIIMKFLPRRIKDHLDRLRDIRFPAHTRLKDELEILTPSILSGEADEAVTSSYWALFSQYMPTLEIYYLGCIEYPFLTTMDELDSLLSSVTENERAVLMEVLAILSAPCPTVDETYLAVAIKFGIQVVDKELIDNMTYQQYQLLHEIVETEQREIRKMYKKMEVDNAG